MCPDDDKHDHGRDEDSALFRRATGKVRRLKSDRVHHAPRRARPEPSDFEGPKESEREMISDLPPAPLSRGTLFYVAPGVQRKVSRKLKRGQIRVEEELDLHGMRVTEAGDALADFLFECATRRLRCVRIIHGKGLRHGGSVLKENVDRWLRLRSDVLAFCSALPSDGGTGAVYVLLKK